MSDIRVWAENLTRDVFFEYQKNYSLFWPHGFKVFYSPIRMNPDLMIISYQPGGSIFGKEGVSFGRGDFSLPNSNEYADKNYLMAQKVRELFGTESLELLKASVAFPLIFFRAPSVNAWKRAARKERKDMEDFSISKVSEIIKKIKPKRILIFGIATYEQLKKSVLCPILTEEVVQSRKKERMMVIATSAEYEIIATIHPSGARISKADFIKLGENLKHQLILETAL